MEEGGNRSGGGEVEEGGGGVERRGEKWRGIGVEGRSGGW